MDKYNWAGINYLSKKDDGKQFDKNNPTSTLNALHAKEKNIYPVFVSKHN